MSCSDIPGWYLQRHLPVIDLRSATWQSARSEVLPSGYAPAVCLRRLLSAGRVRRIGKGLYLVVDPAREAPAIAVASALFEETEHYVTTDAALSMHGLIDQPLVTITVVLGGVRRRPLELKGSTVRPVWLGRDTFARSDRYATTQDGFKVVVASREQAVVDAVAEPAWMTHSTLLPEVLAQLGEDEVEAVAGAAIERSTAAAQRLGYLLAESRLPIPADLDALRPQSVVDLEPGRRGGGFSTRWRVRD
jgi:predicted transcriptional regulator of viral defense system